MRSLFSLVLTALTLVGCAASTPSTLPISKSGAPPLVDGEEPYLREMTGLVSGTTTLNGSVETSPANDDQPFITSVSARTNDLIFFTQKARMSDGSTPSLASSFAGLTNDYGAITQTANFANSYEVRLVLSSEPVTASFWNASTAGGPLNAKAATWEYSIRNAPRDSVDEPDSDNNTATVFDRTMGNLLPIGATVNRSMYNYSTQRRDVEEWWKVELIGGTQYKVELGTYNPRYGTWKYRIQARNPDGSLLSSGSELQTTETQTTFTFMPTVSGIHYLQIAGFHKTKTPTSNVFYSPYWLKVSPTYPGNVQHLAGGTGATVIAPNGVIVDGSSNTLLIGEFDGTADFDPGPGTVSRTSTGGDDMFCLKLSPSGEFLWVATLDGSDHSRGAAVRVTDAGEPRIAGSYIGETDFNPGAGTDLRTSNGGSFDAFCWALSASGELQWVATTSGPQKDYPVDMVLASDGGVRMTGPFQNTVDFDPGAGSVTRTSPAWSAFIWALTPEGNFDWVSGVLGQTGACELFSSGIARGPADVLGVSGYWSGVGADFDPSAGVVSRDAVGGEDAFCLRLAADGSYSWVATAEGNGTQRAQGMSIIQDGTSNTIGFFEETTDFDPGAGTISRTPVGTRDSFIWRLGSGGAYSNLWTIGGAGASVTTRPGPATIADGTSNTLLLGEFSGTADFNPGPGTSSRTAAGGSDAFCLSLDASGVYRWNYVLTGADLEQLHGICLKNNTGPIMVGSFGSTLDFDPSVASTALIATGQQDGFVVGIQPTGSW